MVWVCLIFVVLIILGCYITYKETKHHELHKVRACFENKRHKIEGLLEDAKKSKDEEVARVFMGELIGLKEALEMVKAEDGDEDLIEEIETDIAEIKEKVANLFKK